MIFAGNRYHNLASIKTIFFAMDHEYLLELAFKMVNVLLWHISSFLSMAEQPSGLFV